MRGGEKEFSLNGKKLSDISSNLNNKANADLSNVTYPTNTAGNTTIGAGDRVIESYISSDGKTWYRKWASGWKECGGVLIGADGSVTYTMPLEFSSEDYILIVTPHGNAAGNVLTVEYNRLGLEKTKNSFVYAASLIQKIDWFAYGY